MNTIINELRAIAPKRRLEPHEARFIAERQANRLLELTNVDSPSVPSDTVAGLPRITVETVPNLGPSGVSIWTGGRWLLQLNSDDHPLRQRFSLFHELKHVIDHADHDLLHRTEAVEDIESLCDYFAACALMPKVWVRQAWTARTQDPGQLARLFGVSRQAMIVRLTQLGLLQPKPRCGRRPSQNRSWRRPAPALTGVIG